MNSPMAVLSDLPADMKAAITKAVLEMPSKEKAAIDKLYDGKGKPWQPVEAEAYKPVIELIKFVDTLKNGEGSVQPLAAHIPLTQTKGHDPRGTRNPHACVHEAPLAVTPSIGLISMFSTTSAKSLPRTHCMDHQGQDARETDRARRRRRI